jgi:hypothetical protein
MTIHTIFSDTKQAIRAILFGAPPMGRRKQLRA